MQEQYSQPSQAQHPSVVSGSKEPKFNPDFTDAVINATGPKATPRVRQLTAGLIRHLHDFARENELTVDEWMTAVELVRLDGSLLYINIGGCLAHTDRR